MIYRARIHVMLRKDVADVQGIAIQQSLSRHGAPVREVKAGKYFEIELDCADEATARTAVEKLADGTFANPVIERFWFDLISGT